MKIIYDVYWELDGVLEDYNPFCVHDYQIVNCYYGEYGVAYDCIQDNQDEIFRDLGIDIKPYTHYHTVFEVDLIFSTDYWGESDLDINVKVIYHGEPHPSEEHMFIEESVSDVEGFCDNVIQLS